MLNRVKHRRYAQTYFPLEKTFSTGLREYTERTFGYELAFWGVNAIVHYSRTPHALSRELGF